MTDLLVGNPVVTVGDKGVSIASQVRLMSDEMVTAWEGAKEHIVLSPDRAYIMGRYVHGGLPANRNGHIFSVEDVEAAYKYIPNTPLNLLHQQNRIVGCNVASEMMYPIGGGNVEAKELDVPHVEVLACVWKGLFPDVYDFLKASHDHGSAWFSLEALPSHMRCDTCSSRFVFAGPTSPTYCDHINTRQGAWCENPQFRGNALIVPPAQPGWGDADILQVAAKAEANSGEAENVLTQLQDSGLNGPDAETLMQQLVASVNSDVEVSKTVNVGFDGNPADALMNELMKQVKAEKNSEAHKFHSVMIDVDDVVANHIYSRYDVGSDQKEPHVTVVLVDGEADVEAVYAVVDEWAGSTDGFQLILDTDRWVFENGEIRPLVAGLKSPALFDARERLVEMLGEAGLKPAGRGANDYTPHLTVKYLGQDEDYVYSEGDPVVWDVTAVRLSSAADVQTVFDLG